MGRKILAGVVGAIVAGFVVFLVETVGSLIYPPPADFDWRNPESVRALLASMPIGAFLLVASGWFLGTAAGAWLAAWLGGRTPALVVGALLLTACVFNLVTLPHPMWFWPIGLAAAPLGTMLGLALGRRPSMAV